jgi:conjugative transfer region protein (TIGR03748 family)
MKKTTLRRIALSSLLCLSVLGATASSSFANPITIGRYLSVKGKPRQDQEQLLQQQIQIHFPQNILTNKQAIIFLLQFSGYHMANSNQMHQSTRDMLAQPLPEVDRVFGPMPLEQGLATLAGHPFYLLIDPVHRLVSFKLKTEYQDLYKHSATNQTKHTIRG